jgi:hypothetical protein
MMRIGKTAGRRFMALALCLALIFALAPAALAEGESGTFCFAVTTASRAVIEPVASLGRRSRPSKRR